MPMRIVPQPPLMMVKPHSAAARQIVPLNLPLTVGFSQGAALCPAIVAFNAGEASPRYRRAAIRAWGLALKKRMLGFLRDESGATAIEYGLIAAGVALAIITVVNGLGTKLKTTFSSVSSALK
jgi:pilus assembly protein Flp/PilA